MEGITNMSSIGDKRMASGRYVDLTCLTLEDLSLYDIEKSLNHILRFTGHYKDRPPLTVAQHSQLCLNMAQMFEPDDYKLHLAVFTHDFAEAYIGDVASPVKRMIGDAWYKFAKPIEDLVEKAFNGFLVDAELHERVKMYDLAALDIERRVLWSSQYGKDKWPACPLNVGTIEDKTVLFDNVSDSYIDIEQIWKELYELALHSN